MPVRFALVKFNLMRAIEFFQDMNHEDMDVAAPPSSDDYHKEYQVAVRLNDCLNSMIDEGFFHDLAPRERFEEVTDDDEVDDEEEDEDEEEDNRTSEDDENEADEEADEEEYSTERSGSGSRRNDDETGYRYSDSLSTPRSEGFDYHESSSDGRKSDNSFSGRFKRYVRRILPGRRESSRSNSSSRSRTRSQSRSNTRSR